jgi:hypothetical protein
VRRRKKEWRFHWDRGDKHCTVIIFVIFVVVVFVFVVVFANFPFLIVGRRDSLRRRPARKRFISIKNVNAKIKRKCRVKKFRFTSELVFYFALFHQECNRRQVRSEGDWSTKERKIREMRKMALRNPLTEKGALKTATAMVVAAVVVAAMAAVVMVAAVVVMKKRRDMKMVIRILFIGGGNFVEGNQEEEEEEEEEE